MEKDSAEDQVVAEPFLSTFDICILVLILAGTLLWFFRRKKSAAAAEVDSLESFTIAPTVEQDSNDDGFIHKMKSTNRKVVVFYGSQTGTAEEYAGRLSKEAMRFGMKGMVADPEEIEMDELSELSKIDKSLVIFCLATYGEGDPTDNAQEFYEWLQNGDANLKGINYVVFALGNKTYEHYNSVGIYVDKRLEELGASRVYEIGLGDDDGNLEEDFITWKDKFWPAVCEYFGLEQSGEDFSLRQYKLTEHDPEVVPVEKLFSGEIARLNSYNKQRPPYDGKNPYLSKVLTNRELHKGGGRSCMHIEFNTKESRIRYDAGDHLAVFPTNDQNHVNRIGELLNVDLDTIITLTNLDEDSTKKHPFPCPCTYRTALSHYVDITTSPRTHVLKEIAEFTSDETEKQKLKLMASSSDEGKHLYHDWIMNSNRTIIHVLEDMPGLKPPLDYILELLPRLQARYYSIASSPKAHPESVHITAVLVEYKTPTNRVNKGVTTSWLATKQVISNNHPTVPVYVRKSAFRLPSKLQTPFIMVGPGTGFAPFRGFIQDRHYQKSIGKAIGTIILYFGCRKSTEDFIYEDELKQYVKDGTISKLHTAFSRDNDKKVYVQHMLKDNADEVWDILGKENGHIYVCGDARHMAREVHDVVHNIIKEKGNMTEAETDKYLKKMESQKRYSADVWS